MKNFLALPNVVDMRTSLPKSRNYMARKKEITARVWHHSLTLSHLSGSDAASFAKYHMETNGWPGVAYAIVIEPKHIIQTPHGKRARIVWAHDFDRRTYHVGDANEYSLGICVAGDYRKEKMQDYVKKTIYELQAALTADGTGRVDKSHHEMPGYSWKACCVFDYKGVFKFLDQDTFVKAVPKTYLIQEGDTFWNIANNLDGITVADLLAANPDAEATALQVGQRINLGNAKGAAAKESAGTKILPASAAPLKPGQRITVNRSAGTYVTGELIPVSVKGESYTIMQVKADQVLLKEILSWVKSGDVTVEGVRTVTSPTKEYVLLPKTAASWRTYQLGVQPVAGNSDWSLAPAKFNGLEYEILGRPQIDVATIETSKGKRNIYVAASTGAKIYTK